ncbi:HNH endonuclease [Chloroflexi bacterium TSY]|nr:HNH endonuclease [Chloroflexi bacterium TSY]
MVDILLLNASYEPLAVVPLRRALSLLMRGCVDAATEEILTVQGAVQNLDVPSVLRLRRYINVPRRGVGWSRRSVLLRDRFRCIYCNIRVGEQQRGQILRKSDFTIDHIIPSSRGGKNTWSNTACACPTCNQRKGNRTPHEAGMTLLWEPKMPRVDYVVASGEIPAAWKFYLEV